MTALNTAKYTHARIQLQRNESITRNSRNYGRISYTFRITLPIISSFTCPLPVETRRAQGRRWQTNLLTRRDGSLPKVGHFSLSVSDDPSINIMRSLPCASVYTRKIQII